MYYSVKKSKVRKQCEWFDNFSLKKLLKKFICIFSQKCTIFPNQEEITIRENGTEVGNGAFILHCESFCII